jgi:hypothetical protein
VFGVIKREVRRRSSIEPVIGHIKTDGHLGRRHLKGCVLAWLRLLMRLILKPPAATSRRLNRTQMGLLADDQPIWGPMIEWGLSVQH